MLAVFPRLDLTLRKDCESFCDRTTDRMTGHKGQYRVVERSRFIDDQIAFAQKKAALGVTVADVCSKTTCKPRKPASTKCAEKDSMADYDRSA